MSVFRNTKGETLAETIIALSVLAIGITIASTIIVNSMRNLQNAKNRVVAVNIAREGIEAMRSIRDSNWLLYSDRRRSCWNHDPSAGACTDGSDPILPGTYIIYKHSDGSWRLQLADNTPGADSDGDLNTENDKDLAPLSLVDIDIITLDSDGDGDMENDLDIYNHVDPGVSSPLGEAIEASPYIRTVRIEYMENVPGILSNTINGDSPDAIDTVTEWNDSDISLLNRLRVTAVVSWYRGTWHSAELTTILTDHLGRETLEG